jgi:hypothetical protein
MFVITHMSTMCLRAAEVGASLNKLYISIRPLTCYSTAC